MWWFVLGKTCRQNCGTSEVRDVVVLLEQSQSSGVEGQGHATTSCLWCVSTTAAVQRQWGGASGTTMGTTLRRSWNRQQIFWMIDVFDTQILFWARDPDGQGRMAVIWDQQLYLKNKWFLNYFLPWNSVSNQLILVKNVILECNALALFHILVNCLTAYGLYNLHWIS